MTHIHCPFLNVWAFTTKAHTLCSLYPCYLSPFSYILSLQSCSSPTAISYLVSFCLTSLPPHLHLPFIFSPTSSPLFRCVKACTIVYACRCTHASEVSFSTYQHVGVWLLHFQLHFRKYIQSPHLYLKFHVIVI